MLQKTLLSYGLPVIIDFGADSCIPCKEMAPVLKELNEELRGKAIVKFVDVWKNADGTPYVPKVVGSGCASCKKLFALTQDAVKELAVQADILYVTDMEEIMKTGIMRTPGLIINGKVKAMGRVSNVKEIKRLISDEQ